MPTKTQPTKKFPQGRWCSNRIGGRTFTFDTREQAVTWEEAAKRAVSDGLPLPDASIAIKNSGLQHVCDHWLRVSRVDPKTTKVGYQSSINSFIDYWSPDTPIHAIDTAQVRSFFLSLQDDWGLAPSTVNQRRTILLMVLKFAHDEGLIAEMPKLPPRLKVGMTRLRYLTDDEEDRLLAAMPKPHWRDLTKFMIYTGLRVSEALSVRPKDRTGDLLQVLGKRKKLRVVPLSVTAKSCLSERTLYDRPYFPYAYHPYQRIFKDAREAAGLEDVTIHTLRHTCFSRLAMKDVGVTKIQALAGHSDLKTTQRYMHLAPSYLGELAEIIG